MQDIFGDVRERVKDGAFVGLYKLQKLPQVVETIRDLSQQLVSSFELALKNSCYSRVTE